jgi:hypothetical protein
MRTIASVVYGGRPPSGLKGRGVYLFDLRGECRKVDARPNLDERITERVDLLALMFVSE